MALTSKQRKYLKGLAHAFEPIVRVGQRGVTAAVVEETKKSLFAHELIKVRIDADEPAERRKLAQALAEATGGAGGSERRKVHIASRRLPVLTSLAQTRARWNLPLRASLIVREIEPSRGSYAKGVIPAALMRVIPTDFGSRRL